MPGCPIFWHFKHRAMDSWCYLLNIKKHEINLVTKLLSADCHSIWNIQMCFTSLLFWPICFFTHILIVHVWSCVVEYHYRLLFLVLSGKFLHLSIHPTILPTISFHILAAALGNGDRNIKDIHISICESP